MNNNQVDINTVEHESVATINSRRIGLLKKRMAVNLKSRTHVHVSNKTPKNSSFIRRNSKRSGHLSRHDIAR